MKAALALALLLALPLAGAAAPAPAWVQLGGPGRAGVADITGDLDVLAAYNVTSPGARVRSGSFATPHGVVGLWDTGAGCQMWLLADPAVGTVVELGQAIPCASEAHASAYLPGDDALLLCSDMAPGPFQGGLGQVLQARSLVDGRLLWSAGPAITVAQPGQGNNKGWTCGDIGLDLERGLIAVPFSTPQGDNRLVVLGTQDHKEKWSVTFTPQDQLPAAPNIGLPAVPRDAQDLADQNDQPLGNVDLRSATFTTNGLVVTGAMVESAFSTQTGQELNLATPFMAWLDLDGNKVGSYASTTAQAGALPASGSTPFLLFSETPATQGTHAAALMENDLVVADPAQLVPVKVVRLGSEATTQQGEYTPPVWTREGLFAPFIHQAFLCDPRDLSHCTAWTTYEDGAIHAAVAPGDGTVWVVVKRAAPQGQLVDLVRLRLEDDTTITQLERLPLNFTRADPYSQDPGRYGHLHLLPVGAGRLLVLDTSGQAALLGSADDALRPTLTLGDDKPPVNHPLSLTLTPPAGAPPIKQVLVGWGDGLLETDAPTDTLARQYTRKGDYDIRGTVVYADGRTATTLATVHVGEPKAPPLGLIGKLFSPEWQNYTFFAIGLIVTATTSGLAAASVAKGRKRIDRRLRELDRIQEQGRKDPLLAVRDLHDYRLARRRDLSAGHLDDTQYTVLEAHADKVLQVLRQRILGAFVGRVSEPFSHALDTALADGALDAGEAGQLLARVQDEQQLDEGEKGRLRDLVVSWQAAAEPVHNLVRRGRAAAKPPAAP